MLSSGHEPEKLWRLIDEQNQQRAAEFEHRRDCDLFSHDTGQTWVQAVVSSLRTAKRRVVGRTAAHRHLAAAISRSARSNYLNPRAPADHAPVPHPRQRTVGPLYAAAIILALCLVLLVAAHFR